MAYPPDRETSQLSFGWERPEVFTLGSTSDTATEIEGLTSPQTTDEHEGQMCRVLDGNQAGYIYWVISNDSASLTVQGQSEPNNTTVGSIKSGDRIAISTRGKIPASLANYNKYIGLVNAWTPPHKENEVGNHFSHGSGVTRQISFVRKTNYSGGSMPIIFQGRPELLMSIGKSTTTGTAGAASSTLNGAVYAWDNSVTCVSSATFSTGSYAQIDVGILAEVRKVTLEGAANLTLDQSLDYSHANGVAVIAVVAPWITRIYPSSPVNRTYAVVEAIDDPEADNPELIRVWAGCHTDGIEVSSAEDQEVTGTFSFMAMNDATDQDGTYTKPTVDLTAAGCTEDPYYWDNSVVRHVSTVDLAIVQNISLSWRWNLEAIRSHGANNGKKPVLYVRKFPEFEGTIGYLPVNMYLMEKVDSTERDGYVTWTRAATDYMKVNWNDTIISTDKWDPPENGHYTGEATLSIESISFEIKIDDTAPMY